MSIKKIFSIMKVREYIYKIGAAFLLVVGMASTIGCSDDFLADKRPYGSFGPDEVYNDWTSTKLRLNYIYQMSLPNTKGWGSNPPDIWPVGGPDILSNNTEEFTGWGRYNNPANVIDNSNIDKFFFYGTNESPWKKMRECTDVIVRTAESQTLDENQKKEVDGQARFFRATRYFRLFKRYGGLPIITEIQSTLLRDTAQLRAKRNSTETTFRFIIDDLKTAGDELPVRWEEEANDWGRITAGAAYALAGYVANYYASPVFNRADEQDRWQEAYDLNKTALEKLNEGHFGLSYENSPGTNASNWARIWCNMMGGETLNSEAVYMVICNNVVDNYDRDIMNCWEQQIRPTNALGSQGISPSAEMVDLFPMADGKRPTETGQYTYDKKLFFLNRDPRFYRTFAFPGTEWKFNGTITDHEEQTPYVSGSEYELQNYAWYATQTKAFDTNQSGYFTDLMGTSGRSIYVRKKSQDFSLGERALYNYDSEHGFRYNGQPLLAMRYTEVLLNFAEAACGVNKLDEAYNALVRVRQRVGYTGDCGLDQSIRSDRAKMFEAILYERQIELAYEGKRFDDCHRWMLFDGGIYQNEIGGSSWVPTGWGGNTCAYLGVTPLNNITLHRLEMYFDPSVFTATEESTADPFTTGKITKPKALTLNEDFTTETNVEDGSLIYKNANVKALADFYNNYLQRKDITTMNYTDEEGTVTYGYLPVWSNNCYLMGLGTGDENNNPNVLQTIGWNSTAGGMGAFDPLSKNPVVDPISR